MLRTAALAWFGIVALTFGVLTPRRIEAAVGDCGQPVAAGPTAADALEVLRTTVGASDCGGDDPCVCDANDSGTVTASDALIVLRKAVGQNVTLACPCGATTTIAQTTTTVVTTSTLPAALETKEMHLLMRSEGTYAAADLPGTWELNALTSGPGGSFWARGEVVIAANGDTSGTLFGPDGSNFPVSANLQISSIGEITCTAGCDPKFAGAADSGKTVFSATNTDKNGIAFLYVGTRKGSGYTKTDLAGTWRLDSLVSGPNLGRWSRGTITIDANGAVSIDSVDSDGIVHTINETYDIDANGVITCSHGCRPDFRGVMDSGRTVIAATATNPDNTSKLNVLTRQADSYAQQNLTGNWGSATLAAGPDLPLWQRGTLTIGANGDVSGTLTDDAGAQTSASGTLTIASDGVIKEATDPQLQCSMDIDRTVVACTDSR